VIANLRAQFVPRIRDIAEQAWNALHDGGNPFVDFRFLAALEESNCLHAEMGWSAHHLALYDGQQLVGAAPCYRKTNSHGEFVFDWNWASAYERAGFAYYPKLLVGVPYSPVTGPRLLVAKSAHEHALRVHLANALQAQCDERQWSSVHLNFCLDQDAAALAHDPWMPRFDLQFHWHNPGYRDFADFLDTFTSKKRKNILQERRKVLDAGIECTLQDASTLTEASWRRVHHYYLETFDRKGNTAALTLNFFQQIARQMPGVLKVVLAKQDAKLCGAAILLRGTNTLFGRYWGGIEAPGLHFEACYYQGIEYAIAENLKCFEPGAQGEHKLARGFLPTRTRSAHYVRDERLRIPVRNALAREHAGLVQYKQELLTHNPFK
jgi:uncharacterized protein